MCMEWSGVAGKNGNILCMRRNRAAHRLILGSDVQTGTTKQQKKNSERKNELAHTHSPDRSNQPLAERRLKKKGKNSLTFNIENIEKKKCVRIIWNRWRKYGCSPSPAEPRRDWVSIVQNKLENIFEMEFPSRNLIIIIICIMTCDDGKLVDLDIPRVLPYIVPNGNESLKFRKAKKLGRSTTN